jgi:hypothetical protein
MASKRIRSIHLSSKKEKSITSEYISKSEMIVFTASNFVISSKEKSLPVPPTSLHHILFKVSKYQEMMGSFAPKKEI